MHYKVTAIKTYGIGIRADIQTNGTVQNPKINLHKYGHLIFNKGAIHNGERIISSISDAEKTG